MFTELFGLPAHALIVHAAVVFIPLAALAAIVYALVPRLRRHMWWAAAALAVVAPLSGWAAVLSGDKYKEYWLAHGAAGEFLDQINAHQDLAYPTAWQTTLLGVVTLVMVFVTFPARAGATPVRSAVARWITVVLAVGLALASLYFVIRTGDAGAHAAHPEL